MRGSGAGFGIQKGVMFVQLFDILVAHYKCRKSCDIINNHYYFMRVTKFKLRLFSNVCRCFRHELYVKGGKEKPLYEV